MPAKVVSVTEVVRHFSDYVNRVAYRREAFVLRRGRMTLAELRPVPSGRHLGDLPGISRCSPPFRSQTPRHSPKTSARPGRACGVKDCGIHGNLD